MSALLLFTSNILCYFGNVTKVAWLASCKSRIIEIEIVKTTCVYLWLLQASCYTWLNPRHWLISGGQFVVNGFYKISMKFILPLPVYPRACYGVKYLFQIYFSCYTNVSWESMNAKIKVACP